MKKIILKKGKEKAIINRHHWIFSGAIDQAPDYEDGEILPVYTSDNVFLGNAYFNSKAKIIGRLISFEETPVEQAIEHSIGQAIELRRKYVISPLTNAYRLINGEGDRLPGLIVDAYADCLVIQISTLGMEKLKPLIINRLIEKFKPRSIIEKSNLPSRKEEGLEEFQSVIYGEQVEDVDILENGLKFSVSILSGQKTGFFLDHRNMRELIRFHSKDKKVLNAFSYSGGFSVYALAGGAKRVDSVDISKQAIGQAKLNAEKNNFNSSEQGFYADDVFQFLRNQPLDYEVIILDPPAFAKKKKDVISACRGYKDINRLALKKMPKGSLLLTCSCSYYIDEELFQKVVFQAAVEANRFVRIIDKHHLAADHPINICHPEGDYLKSLLLYVE